MVDLRQTSKISTSSSSARDEEEEKPFGDYSSSLLQNRYFKRTLLKDQKTCGFIRQKLKLKSSPSPVESDNLCGHIPPLTYSKEWSLSEHKWWLNLQNFLYLYSVDEDPKQDMHSARYMFHRCAHRRKDPLNDKQYLVNVNEYGRHLYVNKSGYLCFMRIWKASRDKKCSNSRECVINDVLPKARLDQNKETKQYEMGVIKCLVVLNKKLKYNVDLFGCRWWYKYGREDITRFIELGGGNLNEVMHKMSMSLFHPNNEYFGVYLRDRAKMIMTDSIDGRSDQSNHTLIMGGVFIVINAPLRIYFMDNTEEVLSLDRLTRKYHVRPFPEVKSSHPIVMLDAVPSLADTICWELFINDTDRGICAELGVPLLGMNCNRFVVKDWKTQINNVEIDQNKNINYSHYVRTNIDSSGIPIREQMRSSWFQFGERFSYV